jgi:hypothetical protein
VASKARVATAHDRSFAGFKVPDQVLRASASLGDIDFLISVEVDADWMMPNVKAQGQDKSVAFACPAGA